MSAFCEICHKGTMSGIVRAVVDGEIKRVNVCTRCLRSGKVQRAI